MNPISTDTALDLEHFLPYRLSLLSNRISQAIARLYVERFNLSVTEWRVMAVLGRSSGLSANEVAERTAMDKVAVSRALARLVDAGRVLRSTDDDDRRRSALHLSPSGRHIYDDVAPLALDFERNLLARFTTQEHLEFDRLLDKLGAACLDSPAEQTSPGHDPGRRSAA